jgi:hypothetical protein
MIYPAIFNSHQIVFGVLFQFIPDHTFLSKRGYLLNKIRFLRFNNHAGKKAHEKVFEHKPLFRL